MPNTLYKQACMNNGTDYFLDKSRGFLILPLIIDNYMSSVDGNKVILNSPISMSS